MFLNLYLVTNSSNSEQNGIKLGNFKALNCLCQFHNNAESTGRKISVTKQIISLQINEGGFKKVRLQWKAFKGGFRETFMIFLLEKLSGGTLFFRVWKKETFHRHPY